MFLYTLSERMETPDTVSIMPKSGISVEEYLMLQPEKPSRQSLCFLYPNVRAAQLLPAQAQTLRKVSFQDNNRIESYVDTINIDCYGDWRDCLDLLYLRQLSLLKCGNGLEAIFRLVLRQSSSFNCDNVR